MRFSSSSMPTMGIMISGMALMPLACDVAGGFDDGAHLGLVNLREGDAEAAAAVAQHGVELRQVLVAHGRRRTATHPAPMPLLHLLRPCAAGTRAAAGPADESSPAGRPWRGRCPRSRSAASAGSWSAPGGALPRHRRGSSRARRGCGPARRTCAPCGRDRCPRRRSGARPRRRAAYRRWCAP